MTSLQKVNEAGDFGEIGELTREVPRRDRPRNVRANKADAGGVDAKRVMDVVGAVLALVFFAPAMLIIYVLLFFSGGSPIFAHRRLGKNGALFHCYKFRSMAKNGNAVLAEYLSRNPAAQEEWNRSFKLANDPRVTRFGTFLRQTSLDELPQLFNVLTGDMSLVGPRPIVPGEVERYADKIEAYYCCKPGITGLWQVSGRSLVAYDRRVRMDAVYASRQSVRLDLLILLRTVWVVFKGRGAC